MVGLWEWASIFPCSCHPGPHLSPLHPEKAYLLLKNKTLLGRGWLESSVAVCLPSMGEALVFPSTTEQNQSHAGQLPPYPVFFSVDKQQHQKQPVEERVYMAYMSRSKVFMEGIQGRVSVQELLTGLLSMAPWFFLYSPGPGVALPTMEWALTQLSLIKKMLHRHTQRYIQTSDGGVPQFLEIPFSQICISLC